jgi:glycosyltransferase involved in cell wall biosynthesis
MKILMFASATPHSPLAHRPLALGRELVKRGHEVSLVTPSRDKYSKQELDNPVTVDGVKMIYPYQFNTGIQIIDLLPYVVHASILGLAQRADVSYLSKANPATLPGVIAKWFGRARLVLDSDDLDAEVMKAQHQPAPMWLLVSMCEKIASRSADAIVSASRLLQDQYQRQFPQTPGIRISNGVDIAEFPLAPTRTKSPRIIFFGLMGRTGILAPVIKSLPQIIEMLGSDAVQLDLIGDGPVRPELEQLVQDYNLTDNVHFLGWKNYEQMQTYVAKDDIGLCIMPKEVSTAACSNQKVFQYMAMGLATVVTNVGDLPLYVQNGAAGVVVPPQNPAAIAAALGDLLTDEDLRHSLAAQGHKLAKTTYSWRELAASVDRLLEQLA